MRKFYILSIFFFLLTCICLMLLPEFSFAQIREEKEEMALDRLQQRKKLLPAGLSMGASVSAGYDSNVLLSPEKKGDSFEEVLFSLGYRKALVDKLYATLNYNLNFINYNRFTDASNLLNHFRFGLHNKFSFLRVGAGYDLAWAYYTHSDYDFIFNKAFAYLGCNITKNIYHQLQAEYGVKKYFDIKAIGDIGLWPDPWEYQDKDRKDKRWSGIYSVDFKLSRQLKAGLRARFIDNDSNAIYMNFYDYRSYEGSPYIEYKLTDSLSLLTVFSYIRKNYEERRVALGTEKQRDNLYIARSGLKYKLNFNNLLSLNYIYRNNDSNEDLAEYVEHVISAGWQYRF